MDAHSDAQDSLHADYNASPASPLAGAAPSTSSVNVAPPDSPHQPKRARVDTDGASKDPSVAALAARADRATRAHPSPGPSLVRQFVDVVMHRLDTLHGDLGLGRMTEDEADEAVAGLLESLELADGVRRAVSMCRAEGLPGVRRHLLSLARQDRS